MRKIRDVLRLSAAGLSKRQIAASLGIGPTAAGACLRRAREAGIGWPLPDVPRDNQGETAASIRMRMRRGWTGGARA
jgi:transposase